MNVSEAIKNFVGGLKGLNDSQLATLTTVAMLVFILGLLVILFRAIAKFGRFTLEHTKEQNRFTLESGKLMADMESRYQRELFELRQLHLESLLLQQQQRQLLLQQQRQQLQFKSRDDEPAQQASGQGASKHVDEPAQQASGQGAPKHVPSGDRIVVSEWSDA